ncbi:hypothetical protein CBW24_11440 [Pacificitalea manganoxidans]|uniref:UPF0033 domain-containing protein n=1 Tax=Pacificitalea manganoxidans TaxID=1411902 RepID=A0A291M0S7_9RHOB|nr:sulfurtransferase TusA family protein [Pacificitalea manganoxidans]ATI42559.1 hypothetical protein CBW24_11440 [Pacificitalea manganoxidans]MDR6307575.1 tRNA 2-thiouridine synthesizing protein A [Pacificitalea manganoxidans]
MPPAADFEPDPNRRAVPVCDALGLLCPLPVLRARKRLLALAPGMVLEVLADDPMARIDLPHFCAEAGHHLLEAAPAPQAAGAHAPADPARPAWRYLIRRGADRPEPG